MSKTASMSKTSKTTKMAKPSKTETPETETPKVATTSKTKQSSSTEQSKPKPAPKSTKNLNSCVGFVYGGSLIKASSLYVFAVDSKDVVGYVQENLTQWFGNQISGRFVKCEDSKATLDKFLELATERNYRTEMTGNILKLSVTNGATLLKEVSGSTTASTIKLPSDAVETEPNSSLKEDPESNVSRDTKVKKPDVEKKVATKPKKEDTKKKVVVVAKDDDDDDDTDSDSDDLEDNDKHVSKNNHSSDDEADTGSDSDGDSGDDSEDKPEPVKPVPKNAKTKSDSKTQNTKKQVNKKGKH